MGARTGLDFDAGLELHTVELPKLARDHEHNVALDHWSRFLRYDDPKEIEELAMTDPVIDKAQRRLEEISADPRSRQLAEERQMALDLYRHDMASERQFGREEGRAEGREEGRAEACRQMILRSLDRRGHPVPAELRQRIDVAEPEQLERWLDALMDGEKPEAIFG